jgi:YVTN family beta-propeller protein
MINPSAFSMWAITVFRVLGLLMPALPSQMQVGPSYGGAVLVTSNQLLRPAGSRITLSGTPADLALSPDGGSLAVVAGKAVNIYDSAGAFRKTVQLPSPATYHSLAFSPDGRWLAASHLTGVSLISAPSMSLTATIPIANSIPSGLAFDPARPFLYVALNARNQLGRISLDEMRLNDTLQVGVSPIAVAVTPSGDRLFVANWGGRIPRTGERTSNSAGTPVLVDSRGIAASGAVTAIDPEAFSVLAEIEVGLHPNDVQASPDGRLVAVANANSDSVSILDVFGLTVSSTINVAAYPAGYLGSMPTSLAFSPRSERLYVTCGGNNTVLTLLPHDGRYEISGITATDWYPLAIAVNPLPSGDVLFVANAKGIGSRAGVSPFFASSRLGTVGRVQPGNPDKLAAWSNIAALNDPFRSTPLPSESPADLAALGIKHVFLIIKENRTYDQVLGDLKRGNGNASLAIYGERVTPNHHALASQFVTLDNFYATGVVSADGHQWITQAMASDYIERAYAAGWPRSYPYSGEDPLAFASSGFIWDNALRHGLSVRIFGEFTQAATSYSKSWAEYLLDAQASPMRLAARSRTPLASIADIIDPNYPTFSMNVPDQFRARIFIDAFQQFVSRGQMPNLILIWLPADHTAGTTPNAPSPASMVADNDLALGRIVEAISNSPYWAKSAIFVTEDDSPDGVDHVDGHRTICLVASPYTRRGALDSTSYNQTSIVRTIEDLLGLPPMNKFDAAALPMRSVFLPTPDFSPYHALSNTTSLTVLNADARQLKGRQKSDAIASLKMNFSVPDAAPEETLNRVLWRAAKGPKAKYPKIPHRADCPASDGNDDEQVKR